MRQRLGLAQALINKPEVLLLDEPASALDPAGRKEVLDMIHKLREQCTVFMSTHILADVERVCDRIAIIDRGKLIVDAHQAELQARYSLPAFELECLPEQAEPFAAWAQALAGQPWIERVNVDGSLARIDVNDVAHARQALLPLAAGSGITMRRYEIVRPSWRISSCAWCTTERSRRHELLHLPAQRMDGAAAHQPVDHPAGRVRRLRADLAAAGPLHGRAVEHGAGRKASPNWSPNRP